MQQLAAMGSGGRTILCPGRARSMMFMEDTNWAARRGKGVISKEGRAGVVKRIERSR